MARHACAHPFGKQMDLRVGRLLGHDQEFFAAPVVSKPSAPASTHSICTRFWPDVAQGGAVVLAFQCHVRQVGRDHGQVEWIFLFAGQLPCPHQRLVLGLGIA